MKVRLEASEQGAGPPLAILHGLFGSGRNWATIAQRLAAHYRVIALDLRNHGASPWADTMDYAEMAGDVRGALAARGHRRFLLIGHSMGGKAAMVLALGHGEAVGRLVVVDIAPVAYQPRHLGYVRAMRALDLGAVKRRAEADARLAADVGEAAERGFLLQNLVFDGAEARWRLNLAAIERAMPGLAGFPRIHPARPIAARRCSSPGQPPIICAPSTSRKSAACSRAPGSPASPMPAIGCMPSSRRRFSTSSNRSWKKRRQSFRG